MVALVAAFVAATAGVARSAPAPPLVAAARSASQEYGVPARVLVAVAQVNAHGRMPARATPDGGWGVMHLLDTRRDRQLRLAARLARVSPAAARHHLRANVRAGAALLARLAGRTPQRLEGWRAPLARLGGSALFAQEVLARLGVPDAARRLAVADAPGYADYPGASWLAASRANYQPANRPFSSPITRIVIHTTETPYASAIRFFSRPGAEASAHYVVRSSDGAITQMVHDRDIAWHAGNAYYNATAIGIEHEAFVGDCSWYTDAMYQSSARLVAFLTRKYGIPIDRAHIIGHYQVPDPFHAGEFGGASHHTDPGPCWNWPKYLALVRADAGQIPVQQTPVQVVDDGSRASFSAPGWTRSRQSAQRFGRGYAIVQPSAGGAPASFRLAIPSTGDYAVYAWWPGNRQRNPAVPVGISTVSGWRWLSVDERANGGRWAYLGTFPLRAGTGWDVQISPRTSARGWIAADAVMVEPAAPPLQARLLAGGAGYALTRSALAVTADAGSSWRGATPPGLAASDLRGVRFLDPLNGFVAGLSGANRGALTLARTADGGLTWTAAPLAVPVDVDAVAPVSISAPDATHWFLGLSLQQSLGLPGPGLLLASSNGGRTWSRRLLPASGELSFSTPLRGWLAPADGGLYTTVDGGRTWSPVDLPRPAAYRVLPLAAPPTFADPAHGVLPVTFRQGSRAAVSFLTTRNGGAAWRAEATLNGRAPAPGSGVPAAVADPADWTALLDGGSRLIGLTGGRPGKAVATAGLPLTSVGAAVDSLSFASPTTGWAAVSTCIAGTGPACLRGEAVYRTLDGGATWAPLTPPGQLAGRVR